MTVLREFDNGWQRAILTQPYTVYLATYDTDVTLPAGTEFTLYAKVRANYIGVHKHPKYGELIVETPEASDCLVNGRNTMSTYSDKPMLLSDAIALLLVDSELSGDSYLIQADDMERLRAAPELASAADAGPLYKAAAAVWHGKRLISADRYSIPVALRERLYIASMRDALGLE